MASVTIDNKEYNLDDLSDTAKENLGSLQVVQNEINRLKAMLAIMQTAQSAYSRALQEELDKAE